MEHRLSQHLLSPIIVDLLSTRSTKIQSPAIHIYIVQCQENGKRTNYSDNNPEFPINNLFSLNISSFGKWHLWLWMEKTVSSMFYGINDKEWERKQMNDTTKNWTDEKLWISSFEPADLFVWAVSSNILVTCTTQKHNENWKRDSEQGMRKKKLMSKKYSLHFWLKS